MKADSARRARQEPEYQLKHRVTGAALIAAAAAVAIAVLLGGPGDGGGDAQTIRFDFGDGDGSPAEPAAAAENTVAAPALVTALPDAVPINSGDNSAPPTAAIDAPGWAVRVGAFSKQANIDAVTKALQTAGFQVNTTAVTTAQGKAATSLWLGPYAGRQTAREVQTRAARVNADAAVVRYQP